MPKHAVLLVINFDQTITTPHASDYIAHNMRNKGFNLYSHHLLDNKYMRQAAYEFVKQSLANKALIILNPLELKLSILAILNEKIPLAIIGEYSFITGAIHAVLEHIGLSDSAINKIKIKSQMSNKPLRKDPQYRNKVHLDKLIEKFRNEESISITQVLLADDCKNTHVDFGLKPVALLCRRNSLVKKRQYLGPLIDKLCLHQTYKDLLAQAQQQSAVLAQRTVGLLLLIFNTLWDNIDCTAKELQLFTDIYEKTLAQHAQQITESNNLTTAALAPTFNCALTFTKSAISNMPIIEQPKLSPKIQQQCVTVEMASSSSKNVSFLENNKLSSVSSSDTGKKEGHKEQVVLKKDFTTILREDYINNYNPSEHTSNQINFKLTIATSQTKFSKIKVY
jgi:hypothetical protein